MLIEKIIKLSDHPYIKYASVYSDTVIPAKACILYFHGGGLLYGCRDDLPKLHLDTFTQAGFVVISFDYPLAPTATLDVILTDVCASISHYIQHAALYSGSVLPYFLFGRSAGAYLCLLAAGKKSFATQPLGVVSYYGYGFLSDGWFCTPSPYYTTLPLVESSYLSCNTNSYTAYGPVSTHYSTYVYARQTGNWKNLLYSGRDKDFFLHYTLRAVDTFSYPLFCAHSMHDIDVPYAEFLALTSRFSTQKHIVSGDIHDFDRDQSSTLTKNLLMDTLRFLTKTIG